ncbi:MAG: molybdopterin dinucleotide binding domain-containing protein [Acidimicrobiales bacterium]
MVRVHNEFGEVEYKVFVTDKTPKGCVSVPFGRSATSSSGASANSLTSDELGDLANGPTFCDNHVQVTKL